MKFEPNQPVKTELATVVVDAGLAPGAYRFRLEVVNDRNQRSQPDEVFVTVVRRGLVPIPGPGG